MDDEIEWAPSCPMCQSEDITESILEPGKEIWVEKECNECGVEWMDFYQYTGMDFIGLDDD